MPAINPRISVTVTPDLDALLVRLAGLTGESKSALIGDLLVTSVPVLERMATIIEAAVTAKDEMRTQTLNNLVAAESKFSDLLGSSKQLFDDLTLPLLQCSVAPGTASCEAETDAQTARPQRSEDGRDCVPDSASRPPLVTRGSGTPKINAISPMKTTGVEPVFGGDDFGGSKKALKRPSKASKSRGGV